MKDLLWIMFLSMIPISECRGGLIYAGANGINLWLAYLICVLFNVLPLPFVMLFLRKILNYLKRFRILQNLINKFESKMENKSKKVKTGSLIALFFLVAIPLPGTGGWTGAVVADILNIRMKHALPIIILGVMTAAFITSLVVYGLIGNVFLERIIGL